MLLSTNGLLCTQVDSDVLYVVDPLEPEQRKLYGRNVDAYLAASEKVWLANDVGSRHVERLRMPAAAHRRQSGG